MINNKNVTELCIEDILKLEVLSSKEQLKLVKLAQEGDENAKKKLIKSNLKFILNMVLKYKSNHMKTIDLINEGVIGLIRAIETFKEDKKCVFITYAVWWIRLYINRSIIEKENTIKLPEWLLIKIKKEIKKIHNNNDLSVDVYQCINIIKGETSLNKRLYYNNNLLLQDILEDKKIDIPEHYIKDKETKTKIIESFFKNLTKTEKMVFEYNFGINRKKMTKKGIATKLNVSIGTINNIKNSALKKFRLTKKFNLQKELYNDFIETER